MMGLAKPGEQCLACSHLHTHPVLVERGGKRTAEDESFAHACKAFPNGIPVEIVTDEADHRGPRKGDNGIRFEPRYPGAERKVARLFGSKPTED